jgi:hypothetical protein
MRHIMVIKTGEEKNKAIRQENKHKQQNEK